MSDAPTTTPTVPNDDTPPRPIAEHPTLPRPRRSSGNASSDATAAATEEASTITAVPALRPFVASLISLHSEAGIRRNNEDYCGYQIAPDGSAALLVLSDGMGGHASGEVASRCATDFLLDSFALHCGTPVATAGPLRAEAGADPRFAHPTSDPFGEGMGAGFPSAPVSGTQAAGSVGDIEEFARNLGAQVEAAHRAVLAEAARDAAREGMGATVVAVLALPGRLLVAHVGDSRAIQFRADRVRRLTRDHLFVVDALGLTENVAKRHPQGNILSQALGARDPVQPTVETFDATSGDLVLLCSDGVSEVVGEQEMFDLIYSGSAERRAASLVAAALAAGSRDNCSVLIATLP